MAGSVACSFKLCYRPAMNPGRLQAGRVMSATSEENRPSLTGLWNGLFSYPRLRHKTMQGKIRVITGGTLGIDSASRRYSGPSMGRKRLHIREAQRSGREARR